MGKHRSRLMIIADILSIVKDAALKTAVMYQANLSFTLLERYLDDLEKAGLISRKKNKYVLSTKGEVYLDKFNNYITCCEERNQYELEVKAIELELGNFFQ